MEVVIDRILTYLEAELPTFLASCNAKMQVSDTAKWGVPLTLKIPTAFIFGPTFNIVDFPALQVYCNGYDMNQSGCSMPGEIIVHVTIEVYWEADDTEVTNRMLQRYMAILYRILRENQFLRDTNDENDLATASHIKSMKTVMITANNNPLWNMIQVDIDYHTMSARLESLMGIY